MRYILLICADESALAQASATPSVPLPSATTSPASSHRYATRHRLPGPRCPPWLPLQSTRSPALGS